MTKIAVRLQQFLGLREKPALVSAQLHRPDPNFVPHIPPLNKADFSRRILIVHFWANWNGIDIPMDKELAAVRPCYEAKICFRSCDIEQAENREFCTGIANVPALGCYLDGRRYRTVIGLRKAIELRRLCDECLAAAFEPAES